MAGEVMDILFRARMDVSDVATGIGQIQRDLKGLELPKDITNNLEKGFNKITPLIKEYQKILSKETKTPKDIKNLETLKTKIHEVMGDIKVDLNQISSMKIQPKADLSEINKIKKEISNVEKQLAGKTASLFKGKGISAESAQGIIDKMGRATSLKGLVADVQLKFNNQDIQGYIKAIDALEKKIKSIKTKDTKIDIAKALGANSKDLKDLDNFFTTIFKNMRLNPETIRDVEKLRNNLKELEQAQTSKTFDSFKNGEDAINRVINSFSQLSDKSEQAGADISKAGQSIMSMTEQVGQLQQSTQYFFSLRNMINLLKRGIDEAVQSVKDLDAAMTETAVVTDYKVGDLWGMLPQYTQLANQLGATTQGAYETMTLYFQQGLNQQQAFEIGAETMKMARIAGLDYAETTDMMTAALRGFNMELDETSAKRVNDVYSELAAITASDTEELGKAMQRTASIAHSAGMSFEGTTAFLAQAIETTREPAENIGTAMKTIVARFQEMKKNPLEITEVDGEEVSYNKVDEALQSIGVSLKDTNGQFRELDQVFLDISQRWDGLTQTQQRYIATIAAGSRQQSRFIAMMDNYDRTVQLFEAANNSAGASDEQFGKTMDSLESKLNKLHNAWELFTMGIANNGMIKLAVDGLTGFLNITNKIIDTLSLGSGAIKSFLSVFTAFTGLKVAGRVANSLIGGLGGLVDPQSTVKEGLRIGLFGQGKSNAQASAIYTPIVDSLSKISGQIAQIIHSEGNNHGGQNSNTQVTSKQEYADIKKQFSKLGGKEGFTMGEASSLFSKLDEQHQRSLFNNNPGTKRAMKKASMAWFDSKGFSEEFTKEGKQYISSIYKGMEEGQISVDKGTYLIGRPDLWGEHFANDAARAFSDQYAQSLTVNETDLRNAADQMAERFSQEQISAMSSEEYGKYADALALRNAAERQGEHGQARGVVTDMGRFANDIGSVADKFTQAGYGITAFGNALSQLGGPLGIVGSGISAFGGAISTMGMSISGATGIISLFTEGLVAANGTVLIAGSTIAAVAAPLAALAAGFLLVRHHIKKVKEAGEEVTQTFSDGNKEAQDNISKLKSYQGELASLSQGVDANGNNVNLDDSQYQRYLEIIDDIAAINPEIIQGYNAQGHAIINNNKALEETLKLQQQNQKEVYKTYLRTDSLQKLINARNVNTDYSKAVKNFSSSLVEDSGKINPSKTPLANDVMSLAQQLNWDTQFDSAILEKYGIHSLDALIKGEEQAVKKFVQYQDQIQADLANSGFEFSKEILKGFETLGKDTQAFDEAIKPVYDNLLALVSNSSLYKDLTPELQQAISGGLKDIAGKNLGAKEMQQAANSLMLEFQDAFNKAKPYLTQADEALETFTQDLNEAGYNNSASNIAEELRELARQAEAVGQVEIAEWYENQASRIENAITNATYSIADGIDTLADNIAKAKASFDSLAEGIDDYYTLSDKAKGLVDTALEDKNTGGNGSKTFWRTYQGLASEEAFNRHDKAEALADMEQFQKYFAEGADGAAAFGQKLIDSQNDAFKFTDTNGKETIAHVRDFFKLAEDGTMQITDEFKNLTDEQYAQLAAAFKLSDDGFTAVLNNLRQWGDLDFADPGLIRKALATDERTVTTNKKVAVEGQEDKVSRLYYGQSTLEAETAEKTKIERKELVKDLEVQGSIQLPRGAEELIKAPSTIEGKDEGGLLKQFVSDTKGTGNQVQNVMAALIKSGEYDKEGLEKIHGAIVEQGLLPNAIDANKSFEDIYSAAELEVKDPATEAANEHLSNINSTVNTIAGIIAAGKVGEGYLPDVAKQSGKLHEEIVGKRGEVDTWIQKFGKGRDENGYAITDKAKFNEIYARLDEYKTANDNYINELQKGRIAAEDRGASAAELKAFDDEIAAATHNSDLLSQAMFDASTNFKQIGNDFYNAGQSVFKGFADIRSNPNLSSQEQKNETANVLTGFADKLQKLNFSPEQIQSVFKENFGIELELKGNEFATDIGEQIKQQIGDLGEAEINAVLNIASIKMPGAAKGKNNTPSAIRRVGTMARGSKKRGYTINGEPTLTGELGPELVWEPKQNAAYMVGEHGPQFANLSKNAVVWNAQQTKKIKKNSKTVGAVGTGAKGIHSFGTMAGGNADGAGGTKLPGMFEVDANAMIQDVTPPTKKPEVPVKAKLEVEGATGGGALSKLFGGGKSGPSINVAANVTSINTNEQLQAIKVIGNVTQLNTEATANNINATAVVTQVTKSGQVAGEPIKVKATATTTKVENKAPTEKVSAGTQTMNVTANTAAAQAKINSLIQLFNKTYTLKYKASGPSLIRVPISANFTGSWKKTVEITKSGARGINNKGFGSLAKGTGRGTVGPNNKGGLTLTGEKGFEIAWLPSENRSMILGTNGPQMLNLPKDAVVFNNEQSKKILKQQAILAGSSPGGNTTASGSNIIGALKKNNSKSSNKNKNKKDSKGSKGKKKKEKTKKTINNWSIEEVVRFDADQRLANLTSQISRLSKDIEKSLGKIGTTVGDISGSVQNQIGALQQVKQNNQTLYDSYLHQLQQMDAGYNAVVSYTNAKGKSKEQTINVGDYVYYGDGTYQIDYNKINAIGDNALREAVFKEVNGTLSNLTNGLIKAGEAIKDVDDQLDDLSKKLYETFFGWENQLTWVYDLTQKLNNLSSQNQRFTEQITLELSKLSAGFGDTASAISSIRAAAQRDNKTLQETVKVQQEMIEARKAEMYEAYSWEDEIANVEAVQKLFPNSAEMLKQAQEELNAAMEMRKYVANPVQLEDGSIYYDIDWQKFNEDRLAGNMTKETADAIKNKLDDLNSSATSHSDAIKELTSTVNENYQRIREYQETMADLEADLLDGLEEAAEQEIENTKKLSDSLTDVMKDLLDEVKRKLDERRQQEDNAKTELDISQKQQRLAMLRADTSGGNAVEIARLEKEITNAQQDYQRSLEDQLLERLNNSADEAAKQREHQIELLEQANEIGIDNRELVRKWVENPELYQEEITNTLKTKEGFENQGYIQQELTLSDIASRVANVQNAVDQVTGRVNEEAIAQRDAKQIEKDSADEELKSATETLESIQQRMNDAQAKVDEATNERIQAELELQRLGKGGTWKRYESIISEYNRTGNTNGFSIGEIQHIQSILQRVEKAQEKVDTAKEKEVSAQAELSAITDEFNAAQVVVDDTRQKVATIETDLQKLIDLANTPTALSLAIDWEKAGEDFARGLNTNGALVNGSPFSKQEEANNQRLENALGATAVDNQPQVNPTPAAQPATPAVNYAAQYQEKLGRVNSRGSIGADGLNSLLNVGAQIGKDGKAVAVDLAHLSNISWDDILGAAKSAGISKATVKSWSTDSDAYKKALKKHYKTGGLADFTGPAWLDGTPSKPELVLNARDTKNFIALKDVLSHVMSSTNNAGGVYGNATYEININVDHLNSDYDVDRVVERVKQKIVKDSSYRNVTQVRNFR